MNWRWVTESVSNGLMFWIAIAVTAGLVVAAATIFMIALIKVSKGDARQQARDNEEQQQWVNDWYRQQKKDDDESENGPSRPGH